ncbi:MAG: hypothetical protein R3321_14695 [Nitrososphaeraceae archaeon]|nr:hypothetical protein [Nitrososphaeraceae archaeon]
MKSFQYKNLGYWFTLLIIFVIAGFYTSYFSRFFEPTENIIHTHFVLMALWIVMLIAQPFLIKFKMLSWHRLLGKASYVLVPLVLITSWFVTRNEYYKKIEYLQNNAIDGIQKLSPSEIIKAASVNPVAFIALIWFITFYSLAIIYRKQSNKHARYMLATALILLSPTIDRFVAINLGIETIAGIASFIISFLIIDLTIAYLLFVDFKNKREIKTLTSCLLIFVIGQVSLYILPNFDWWASFMELIMMPKP